MLLPFQNIVLCKLLIPWRQCVFVIHSTLLTHKELACKLVQQKLTRCDLPWDIKIKNLPFKYSRRPSEYCMSTKDHRMINKWLPPNWPFISAHSRYSLGCRDVIWDTTRAREVLTMFLSSLNPTPAQPAFPLSSNSTVSPILWNVTKKSQSSLDVQESGILKLSCAGAVVVGPWSMEKETCICSIKI